VLQIVCAPKRTIKKPKAAKFYRHLFLGQFVTRRRDVGDRGRCDPFEYPVGVPPTSDLPRMIRYGRFGEFLELRIQSGRTLASSTKTLGSLETVTVIW
jgi:hypothetical protein